MTRQRTPGSVERNIRRTRERREAMRAVSKAHKARPCHDCGVQYPHYVMQLDHRPGEPKHVNPCKARTAAAFLREALSCDVVCANCHAERTWRRMRQAAVARRDSLGPTLPFD